VKDTRDFRIVDSALNTHEKVCEQRYKRIEERLKSGSERFDRLEKMVWGIYVLLISSALLPNILASMQ
jgi:hypothetical protein